MLLEITNVAKISSTTVSLNGITVIAGDNNTGKSTVGKSLYCIFKAFYNSSEKLFLERKVNLASHIERYLQKVIPIENRTSKSFFSIRIIRDSVAESLLSEGRVNSAEELSYLLIDIVNKYNAENTPKALLGLAESIQKSVAEGNDLFRQILETISISDDAIQKIIISRCFINEFDGQLQHLNTPNKLSKVTLTIKEKTVSAEFKKLECHRVKEDINIVTEAIYIDTPFVIDDIDPFGHFGNDHRSALKQKLDFDSNNDIVNEAIGRKKVERILGKISSVVDGKFIKDDSGVDSFTEKGIKQPVHLSNLSTGLKTFVIIKRLIENGSIQENGVLILDEPEIHLHPKWQLIFAEVLVLLQKEFNLNILLNTHSPYFLSAIEVFSAIHETTEKCKYYLSDLDESGVIIKDVTDQTALIYSKLAEPLQSLENLRYQGE